MVVKMLREAASYIEEQEVGKYQRDYHDHKTKQLLDVLAELLWSELMLECWIADLGVTGCTV